MKKYIVIEILVGIVLLVLIIGGILIINKDRIFIPFESETVVKLNELNEYKKISESENITKIEVLSQSTKDEFTNKDDINKVLALLDSVEGYRISADKYNLVSNTYGVVVYFETGETITIEFSPKDFKIGNEYYKNSKNYYVLIRNLVEELN